VLDAGIPVVAFGDPGLERGRISIVENDYADAMRQAVGRLAELGHREIGYVSGLARSQRSDSRIASFRDAMRERLNRTSPPVVAPRTSTLTEIHDGERLGAQALQRYPALTAVVCTNDLMAIGTMRAAVAAGRRVPDDLSVVGIDDAYVGTLCSPALTTLAADYRATGVRAFRLLYADIAHAERSRVRCPLTLVQRGSTATAARPSA